MRNRSTQNPAPQISDFSEALLHAGSQAENQAARGASENYEDALQAMLNQEGAGNSNLSNVLNKIRDRGPAGKPERQRRRKERAVQQRQQQDVVSHLSDEAMTGAGQNRNGAANTDAAPHNAQHSANPAPSRLSPTLRQQLPMVFMLIALFAIAAMQFYTDRKLTQLASSQQYTEQGNDLSITTALDGQQQIAQLQSTLTALSDKVQQLGDKLAQQTGAANDSALIDGLHKLEQKLDKVSRRQQDSIAALKKQVAVLDTPRATGRQRAGMAASSTKAVARKQGTTPIKTPAPSRAVQKQASVTQKPSAKPGWRVNLAALSNRQLARKASQRLKGAGVTAMIEEIELKGKKVYRLSVDGFASKQAARAFVKKARGYGFDKGWIREAQG